MQNIGILKNRVFAKLWLAQMFSATAQHFLNFALILRVYAITGGSNLAVGLYILCYGLPSILLAQIAGLYIDHLDRRKVMRITNLLRAILVLGYIFAGNNLFIVFGLSFVMASITQFFTPAESASIPDIVAEKNLLQANSLFVMSFYATFVLGFSLSAPIVGAFGATSPYFIAALMFSLASVCAWRLPALPPKSVGYTLRMVFADSQSELKKNWQAIVGAPKLLMPIGQLTAVQAVLGVVLALAPSLSLALFALPLTAASQFLIIPAGLGMVFGVIVVSRKALNNHKLLIMKLCALLTSLVIVVLGFFARYQKHGQIAELLTPLQSRLVVAGMIFVLGVGNAIISSIAQTLLQDASPAASRGRIFGALNMLLNIASIVPVLIAARLADYFGLVSVLTWLGIILLLASARQLLTRQRNIQSTQA